MACLNTYIFVILEYVICEKVGREAYVLPGRIKNRPLIGFGCAPCFQRWSPIGVYSAACLLFPSHVSKGGHLMATIAPRDFEKAPAR